MEEGLYGPWQVTADVILNARRAVRIAGSVDADGVHEVVTGQQLELVVTGEEWTLELMTRSHDEDGWRLLTRVNRRMTFEPGSGLTVRLNDMWTSGISPSFLLLGWMFVRCVSLDPETNPAPSEPPPDFSFPSG